MRDDKPSSSPEWFREVKGVPASLLEPLGVGVSPLSELRCLPLDDRFDSELVSVLRSEFLPGEVTTGDTVSTPCSVLTHVKAVTIAFTKEITRSGVLY